VHCSQKVNILGFEKKLFFQGLAVFSVLYVAYFRDEEPYGDVVEAHCVVEVASPEVAEAHPDVVDVHLGVRGSP
jgi:hypothetical protein